MERPGANSVQPGRTGPAPTRRRLLAAGATSAPRCVTRTDAAADMQADARGVGTPELTSTSLTPAPGRLTVRASGPAGRAGGSGASAVPAGGPGPVAFRL